MKNRELHLIKGDLKVVTSNKLNLSQSKLLLMGIIYEIIHRKDLFPRNVDLKPFVQQVLLIQLEDVKPFRDYLYVSRALLGSRINKIILFDFEYNNVIDVVEKLNSLLPAPKDELKSSSTLGYSDDEMSEWINFIRGNVK